jgi:V8-like Glu-specific endopeptidase
MKRSAVVSVATMSVFGAGLGTVTPAAAVTAIDLCAGSPACIDELPVANDATVQAQFDAQTPPTQVPVLNPTAAGGATSGTMSADSTTFSATAFPSGYVARTQVTTNVFPDKDAGHLVVYFQNATSPTGYCTGALIGAHLVGTAGHCVYQANRGWATRIDFIPGQINGTTYTGGTHPYGTCYGDLFMTVNGWKDSAKSTYDYGAVRLGSCSTGDRNVGNRAGYAGFHSSSNESISGLGVNLHGYPDGAPLYKTPGTLWKGVNGSIYNVQTHQFFYRIQTAGGDSGGPVWRYRTNDCGPGFCIYAVHTGALADTSETVARRLTDGMFNNWKNWRSQ